MSDAEDPFSRGSTWQRWDPHIHAPGTVLNDQFGGGDAWNEYLGRIEAATPKVVALGITDYWSLDLYEQVVASKDDGRLPRVELIFPNVEIRFGIGTSKGGPINGHLLISPEDQDHLKHARRFLESLRFSFKGEDYRCNRDELIALGKAYDPEIVDEKQALVEGTNQFKVSLDDLKGAFAKSGWARSNILVGVAAGSNDGTSGLSKDASLGATRREIERTADLIFSANPKDRKFWLGDGILALEELRGKYDGAKPCLHGSDAHGLGAVCAPDQDRYCWLKGEATFESLRQAIIEPGSRVSLGREPPAGALAYRVIDSIALTNADWCRPQKIDLNAGLVGIIGARGSGKTALADLIAMGARSQEGRENDRSFIHRAEDHLSDLGVTITWGDGETWTDGMKLGDEDLVDDAGVQYLSQQFVERLCAAEGGVSDDLLAEIERVIFEEHPQEDRLGATTFQELLEMRASRSRQARDRSREALDRAVAMMSEERRREAQLSTLKAKREFDLKSITEDKDARKALISRGSEGRVKRLEEIQAAAEKRRVQLDSASRRHKSLEELRDFVEDAERRKMNAELDDLKTEYRDAGLEEDEWVAFLREFSGDVEAILKRLEAASDQAIAGLRGTKKAAEGPDAPFVPNDAELERVSLFPLSQEAERLRRQIGMDDKRAAQLKALDQRITQAEGALGKLDEQITRAEASSERIEGLKKERTEEYGHVFDALVEEEELLGELYAPLAKKLSGSAGALGKLTFEVRREVNVEAWAEAGEDLLDLRKVGPFKGHGALLEAAKLELLLAWQSGDSAEIAEAFSNFRESHDRELLAHSPVPSTDQERYWRWAAQVANWLDDTTHIEVRYGIQYDGVDIEQLSPGTRGIVLLLLYLSIDQTDNRPLIIDQPEENLDPKSVFDELVGRFRETRNRRQVIVVTHNANLIVNTDADQVIVAEAGPHRKGRLPEIEYRSGGLEDPDIRKEVCDILEGGERAFVQRAERLRVRLNREG
jgi:ABC-type lipoprotein export system ATPase subunit